MWTSNGGMRRRGTRGTARLHSSKLAHQMGLHFSNGYFLEQELRWHALNVEAHPETYKKLLEYRPDPRNTNVNSAVCDPGPDADFTTLTMWGSSPSAATNADARAKPDEVHEEEIPFQVKCRRMSDLEQQADFARKGHDAIAFVSLDVEGAEVQALKTRSWDMPIAVLLVEMNPKLIGDALRGPGGAAGACEARHVSLQHTCWTQERSLGQSVCVARLGRRCLEPRGRVVAERNQSAVFPPRGSKV